MKHMKVENDLVSIEDTYPLADYPEVESVEFPKQIYVAYAVCSKNCGNKEFIVDGQTQVCEYCKKQMFRTEVRKYTLSENQD